MADASQIIQNVGQNYVDGDDEKEFDTDHMDIIEFVESEDGLSLTRDLSGIELFPVQKFILKAFYNEGLNDEDKTIRIPKNWRFAQSQDESDYYDFTEQEYMEYLYNNGRCNVKELEDQRHELILPIGRRSGKCIRPDSLVVTDQGLLEAKELGNLNGDTVQNCEVTVSTGNGESTTDKFYNGSIRETKKIETSAGYQIEGTTNHRVKVLSKGCKIEWRYLDDIEEGDQICINRGTDLWPEGKVDLTDYHNDKGRKEFDFPEKLDENWATILGLLVGDGTWNIDNRTEITVGPYPELVEFVRSSFKNLFGDVVSYGSSGSSKTSSFKCHGVALRQFLDEIGWDLYPDEKTIPWSVRRSPKHVVASFLSGYFEADGSISSSVTASAKDHRLLEEIQALLLNFGIVSDISSKKVNGKTYWRLRLRGHRSFRIFLEEIGFLTNRKQEPLERLVENGSLGKSSTDSIPFQTDILRKLRDSSTKHNPFINGNEEKGYNRCKIRDAVGNSIKNCSNDALTYSRIQNLLDLRGEVDADEVLFDHFEDLINKDYFFDDVEDVSSGESKVVDLRVPEDHEFTANGLVNHNTFLSGIISSYETYKLLRKGNPQKYYGLPEGDRIQICSVATRTKQAEILYDEAKGHFNNCDFYDQYMAKNTMKFVQFQTPRDIRKTGRADEGGDQSVRVTFYPSSSTGIRGSANIVAIMDEAAFFADNGDSSAESVYEAIAPSVATFSPRQDDPNAPIPESEGKIIMISSPSSKSGLFYDKYRSSKGSGAGSDDILMIQAPTWEVNPTISKTDFEKAYDKNPHAFQTEFGAQFSDKVKTWIEREDDLQVCINTDLRPKKKGRTRDPHYLGLDLAAKNDMTALVLTKPNNEKVQMVYHELWQAGKDWHKLNPHLDDPWLDYCLHMKEKEVLSFDKMAEWVKEISKKFYIDKGVFDQFEGISFEQTIHKMGLTQVEMENFRPAQTSEIFRAFRTLMHHEKLELYDYVRDDEDPSDHSPYINELLELRSESSGRRNIKVHAPETTGKHDDFSDALVRSVWLCYNNIKDGVKGGTEVNSEGKVGAKQQPNYSDHRRYQRQRKKSRNYTSKRDPNRK